MKMFRLGFLPDDYFKFELDKNNHEEYMPTLHNYNKANLNGHANSVLINKILFPTFLKEIIKDIDRLHVIDNLGYINEGEFISTSDLPGNIESLVEQLEYEDLIIKPAFGRKGKGLIYLSKPDEQYFINEKVCSVQKLKIKVNQLHNYVVQNVFRQNHESNFINPDGFNSMRILTMIDPVTEKAFIPFAYHKFAVKEVGRTDSCSQGALSSSIHIESGELSQAIRLTKNGEKLKLDRHTDTDLLITGQKIHHWEEIKRAILEMANRMPYMKYVGWDVIQSGKEVYVLEGNNGPSLNTPQLHIPFKNIPAAWSFYEYYNFIK